MYLSIPIGMKYEQIAENESQRDYFVDPNGVLPRIDIQKVLKEALRTNTGRAKHIELGEFTIYRVKPPYRDESFLHYIPNCNGRHATKEAIELVNGTSFPPPQQTRYGTFWFQALPLDPTTLEGILERRAEQREDRRHSGDSPKPT